MASRDFFFEMAGRVGPPIFAATLVACLLEGRFQPLHGALLATGVALMTLSRHTR